MTDIDSMVAEFLFQLGPRELVSLDAAILVTQQTYYGPALSFPGGFGYKTQPPPVESVAGTFNQWVPSVQAGQMYFPTNIYPPHQAMLLEGDVAPTAAAAPPELNLTPKRQGGYVKKPMNAFMLFLKEQRANVDSDILRKGGSAVNVELGKRWKSLSDEKKVKYFQQAKLERDLHHQQHPKWSAKCNYGKRKQDGRNDPNINEALGFQDAKRKRVCDEIQSLIEASTSYTGSMMKAVSPGIVLKECGVPITCATTQLLTNQGPQTSS